MDSLFFVIVYCLWIVCLRYEYCLLFVNVAYCLCVLFVRYHGNWKSETQAVVSLLAFLHWLETGTLPGHAEAEQKLGCMFSFALSSRFSLIDPCNGFMCSQFYVLLKDNYDFSNLGIWISELSFFLLIFSLYLRFIRVKSFLYSLFVCSF